LVISLGLRFDENILVLMFDRISLRLKLVIWSFLIELVFTVKVIQAIDFGLDG
jgi:hypothetical protein